MNEIYDKIGKRYSIGRRTDPYIASQIHRHLLGAESILNIGGGTGSYEPGDYTGVAVEPSSEMISQRPPGAFPVKQARAELLPFGDKEFSHSMTILSMHHWMNRNSAFNEIKRVTRKKFIAVTWDPESSPFWLTHDYFPEIRAIDEKIFPSLSELHEAFPGGKVFSLKIPEDCTDGFLAAYWKKPDAYLDGKVRACMSTFQKISLLQEGLEKLDSDICSGVWDVNNRKILEQQVFDAGYRVFVADIRDHA